MRWCGLASLAAVGVIVQQPFARVPAVDEPEVRRWLVEAGQFLEALRKLADLAGIGAEGMCLTRAEPWLRVVDDHPEPGRGAGVGTGAVPQAAGEEQHGSGWHFHRHGRAQKCGNMSFPSADGTARRGGLAGLSGVK